MTAPTYRLADEDFESVIANAAKEGFQLVQFETSDGQVVWEWRHGDDPRPQFAHRRVAVHFMDDLLHRMHTSTTERIRSSDRRSLRTMSQRVRRTGP